MANDRKAIRRAMEKMRGKEQPGSDADAVAEYGTRNAAVALLLQLPDEQEFIEKFRRFMIDCGLQVGPQEIGRARSLWRSHH